MEKPEETGETKTIRGDMGTHARLGTPEELKEQGTPEWAARGYTCKVTRGNRREQRRDRVDQGLKGK